MTSLQCCLGLTVFAFRTKYDYTLVFATQNVWQNHSKSIKIILAIHGVIFLFFLVLLIVYSKFFLQIFNIWFCVTVTPLLSMRFILDTQLLMGGKHKLVYSTKKTVVAGFQFFYIFIVLNFLMIDFIKYFGRLRE